MLKILAPEPGAAGRIAFETVCRGVCGRLLRVVHVRGGRTEPLMSISLAGGAHNFVAVFVHQAFHALVASGAGICGRSPPAAAWIAVRGSFDWRILPLVGAVTFWVGGSDVLYACQDYDFDCEAGLHSLPRFLGIRNALVAARFFHLVTFAFLLMTAWFSVWEPWPTPA